MAEVVLGVFIIFIFVLLIMFGIIILGGAMIDYIMNDNTDEEGF